MKRRMFTLPAMFAGVFLVASGPAPAIAVLADDRPLSEQRVRQAEERQLQQEVAFTSNQCGTAIRASINWGASSSWPNAGKGIAKACDGALSAVEAICRSGDANKVKSKIRSFQCSGNGSGPSLSGSTLRYGARPGSNGFSQTRSYLERAL